ncbi:S26 family signal peptidase [Pectinatus frisingensis]|uniref:S26 family signal peptidase n=1 Tax=Pectinatus frisingensis TaxID=865 RepID=UPI0018C6EE49|nr:S26 family signal peptidase [Pectinatus frisingensis]
MNCLKSGQKKLKIFMIAILFGIAVLGAVNIFVGKLFYINSTDSAPRGIYLISLNQNLHYGDYVIVALPVDVPKLHVEKGFLLLKQVRGFPGDKYTVSDDALELCGKAYKIFQQEGLPQLETGERQVPDNEMLLLNDRELSFDSRYLGPISKDLIVKKVDLLVPYEPFTCFVKKVIE